MQNTQLHPGVDAQQDNSTAIGDYRVAYRLEKASGVYEFSAGVLEWKAPSEENVHLAVTVSDPQSGRFIPGMHITATFIDSRGGRAATTHLPFIWHPDADEYGANVKVPANADYVLQLHMLPPTFARADRERGKRFVSDENVTFNRVHVDA